MRYNGNVVSELGIKKYLAGVNSRPFSNIDPVQSRDEINQRWQECNFGCHGPSYRVSGRNLNRSQFLNQIENYSPFAAGLIDGTQHHTIGRIDRLAEGMQRTAEGLGAAGQEGIARVGSENYSLYRFVRVNVTHLLNLEVDNALNPLAQLVFQTVDQYISLIPEEVIIEIVVSGALVITSDIESSHLRVSVQHGNTESFTEQEIEEGISFLRTKGQRFIGKRVGKRLAQVITRLIASQIASQVLRIAKTNITLKRRLERLRASYRPATGHLANLLSMLLEANGWLGIAARESRALEAAAPKFWRILRNDMNGLDMILFLISDFVQEYIDRISVIENNPSAFIGIMSALIESGRTREILFPRS